MSYGTQNINRSYYSPTVDVRWAILRWAWEHDSLTAQIIESLYRILSEIDEFDQTRIPLDQVRGLCAKGHETADEVLETLCVLGIVDALWGGGSRSAFDCEVDPEERESLHTNVVFSINLH